MAKKLLFSALSGKVIYSDSATQEILKAIEIAQSEGYVSKDGHLTAAGKSYVEQNKEVFSLVE